MTQTILITGATGAIGPRVVNALDQVGYRIRTFSIDVPALGIFPPHIDVVIGDVMDKTSVESIMQGVDAVVHMAALLHIVNPPPEMREKYERVNIGGTATVVEAAIKAGVKRVVLFSTIAVYGHSDGHVLNEMSPTHTDTFYAQTKCAAERIVLDAKNADGQPLGTVLRLGAVYGSRIKGNYERLTHALAGNLGNLGTRYQFLTKLGQAPSPRFPFIPIGNGLNRRTLVYDKDVGRAAALAVSHPAAAGRVFNVTDGGVHTLNEIIQSICSALGRKPPRLSLPVGPTRALIGLLEKGSRAIGLKPPVTLGMIDKYTEDIAVNGSLIQKELGFMPQYDLKTGWEETIRKGRENR
ncbi:NAD-dependent epimerase/dehydratase family protein [Candidatus Parcubacteria bacterium]|nr:MAG: NAD-dependent epimerase/dehydratase family protein [Candidatus Parcubacteria bacterium]